ncbi:sensory transduction histidine kinase [Methanosarcina barkeri str. Wiesmoor]|uniref:Sensory transduction histidine kinase n=2 Tax=Methanosarcina barkeri TaxID=2208 RepID=A0A0E3QK79_METBA|nr:PAS domain-containing protein [Methanosarcina barkeri]AKB50540.1 sensory transduction histidine kinase [Methanosarcina barkeri str. Wiesmoor]
MQIKNGGLEVIKNSDLLEKAEKIPERCKEIIIEELSPTTPNIFLRLGKEGTVLCANKAANALLKYWDIKEGEKVPQELRHNIRRVLTQETPENLEIQAGKTTYVAVLYPFPENKYVNLEGFNISLRLLTEEKLSKKEKQYLSLSNLSRLSITCKNVQAILEESALIIAKGLDTEFTRILELKLDGTFIMRAGYGWKGEAMDSVIIKEKDQAEYTLVLGRPIIQEGIENETRFECIEFLRQYGIASGVTVLIGSINKPFVVVEVYSREKKEFTEDDIYFLDSAAFLLSEIIKHLHAEEELQIHQQELEELVEKKTLAYMEANEKLVHEVIERRKIENKLQNNVQFLETLLDNIPSPVFQRDLNETYVNCNESFARQIMGLPKEEVIGSSFLEFHKRVPKELAEIYLKDETSLIEEKGSNYYETKVICADGVHRDFLFHKTTYQDRSGKVAGIVGIMHDITQRKAAEKTFRKSEERYRIAAEQTGQLVYDYDLDSGKIDWAGAISKLTGYSSEDFKQVDIKDWITRIHEDDQERAWKNHQHCMKTGGKYLEEYRFKKKDGSYFHAEDSGIYFLGEKGQTYRAVGVIKDITERKLAGEVLEINEERYRAVAVQTGQLIYDYDVKSNCSSWVGAIEELTGYSFEEFQGLTPELWADHVHPEDRKKAGKAHESCMNNGEKYIEEYRFRRKDGNYFPVEDSGVYLKDESKGIYRVLGVIKDITERKKATERVQKSEERYRIVTEQTGQIVYDYDRLTGKIEWSGAIKELTQYSLEEFQNFNMKAWEVHIHPEDRKEIIEQLEKYRERGNRFVIEYRFQRKDGTYLYFEDSRIFLKDGQGHSYRDIGVMKDITGLKLASKKLKESEERYRFFMKNYRGIAFQGNLDFKLILLEGSVEEITGYRREDFISGKVNWRQIVLPEDWEKLVKSNKRLKNDALLFIEHEYRIRHRDGKIKWVREIVQNISDPAGKKRILHGAVYDITGQKEAEESLRKIEEIRKKEIHHRIKNNLQVISSLLELQAEKFSEKEVLEAFRESQNRVATMAIIHEELYRSRNSEVLDFSEYLQKLTADLLRSYSVGGDVRMQLDVEETFIGMDTAVPLGIIINELVSNSLKHAFPQDRKGEIRIKLCKAEENVKNKSISNITNNIGAKSSINKSSQYSLVVSDNGLGFPEGLDFRNTSSLGLQLVNILVEQLEGTIELQKDSGTTFKILFRENN